MISAFTCACSEGGPGRKLAEHMGDNSTLGTIGEWSDSSYTRSKLQLDQPKNPSFGRSTLGSATSAFIPQTTVVPPIRTMALPFAVVIAPCLMEVGLNVCKARPSGRTFSSINRLKYSSGFILSKILKLKDDAT